MFPMSTAIASVMGYESSIWAAADILRSSLGVKDGDKPDFMIPFFALRLLEAKILQAYNREYAANAELYEDEASCREATLEAMQDRPYFNKVLLEERLTLQQVVANDALFSKQFKRYLEGFTDLVQNLLGVVNSDKLNNLNIANIIRSLDKSNSTFSYVKCWAAIDFAPFPMSDVVLLEEHIKGKWAEMSAETAGEHYTPYDIVDLAILLFKSHARRYGFYKPYSRVYDPTCGAGGALTRVAEKLELAWGREIRVRGQELNGALAALAKIDAMTRDGDADIKQGNTLVVDMFPDESFDFLFSNPPYGVSWKNEELLVKSQADNRLGKAGYPGVGDGQLLFVEHVLHKMEIGHTSMAVIILNGSPLFSGDAGSGESEIRRYLLDNDLVSMIIQLPSGEFFNTGIGTYAWVLETDRPAHHRGKIVLANAEDLFKKLKKNFGDKNKELDLDAVSEKIIPYYESMTDSELVRVLPTSYFYYNRQSLKRLMSKESAPAIGNGVQSVELDLHHIRFDSGEFIDVTGLSDGQATIEKNLVADLTSRLAENQLARIVTKDNAIISVLDEETVSIEGLKGVEDGNYSGVVKLTAKFKKATKVKPAGIEWTAAIEPIWIKDEERIPYHNDELANKEGVAEFLKKWVSPDLSHVQLLNNVVGVEINFNSLFSKSGKARPSSDILRELADLDILLKA